MLLAASLGLLLVLPAEARAQEAAAEAIEEEEAHAILDLARDSYRDGDFSRAVSEFSKILGRPVRLKTRADLHDGFLLYAFTLFLQGESENAGEKLSYALRLDPEFQPSPVTTRPDLLAFYAQQQGLYVQEHGTTAEPPPTIFPELQGGPTSSVVVVRRRFVPLFGIGLRQLGHRPAGDVILTTEVASAVTNITGILLRLGVYRDLSVEGFQATYAGRALTYAGFGVFWATAIVDFIVSLSLRRHYTLHPERRPNTTATPRAQLRPARVELSASGLRLLW